MEVNEITKLHKRDTTSSDDESLRYAQSYKLILTTSTTHPVNNETTNLYTEGATLSNFIHEGRPITTKLTLVDLPSSIDHSTFRKCSNGTLCLPPTFHHRPLTRPVVIISYSLRLGRHNTRYRRHLLFVGRPKGIHTEEINLFDFKEWHDLPSWYPIFQLPYQIDAKVTCTGFYVYIEMIYIDSSPDPDIFAPFPYYEPSDEFIRNLYNDINDTNYISDH